MTAHAALVTNGLQPLVEQLEGLPAAELGEHYADLRRQVGSPRHVVLLSVLAAARSLDWAPFSDDGQLDLTPATARHIETLSDRLPVEEREVLARLYAHAVAHRIHGSGQNAPFLLPEVAPDADRLKDPKAAFVALQEQLTAGAVSEVLHSWPCCLTRTPWSQVTETIAATTLRDGATSGGRAIAAAGVRRFLEIVGREHRHPVITALWRALAAAPRGEDPTPRDEALLDGVPAEDTPRDPGGTATAVPDLARALAESSAPEEVAAERLRGGEQLGTVMNALSLAASREALAAEVGAPRGAAEETLVVLNSLRDVDGHDRGWLRPRVVIAAARIFGSRRLGAHESPLVAAAAGASAEALGAALEAGDAQAALAQAAGLAAEPRLATEAVRVLDRYGVARAFSPTDLAPVRLHVAAVDELRWASPEAAPAFLVLATRSLIAPT